MSRKRLFVILGAVVVLGAAVSVVVLRGNGTRDSLAASGTVEATEARLGFEVTGRIESVSVREGDRVRAGDELAALDRQEMQARRDQAEAQVAAARALLRELERGFRPEEIAQARAARDAAKERHEDAQRDLERTRRLYDGGAVSQEVYDKARLAVEIAKNQYEQVEEQWKLLEAGPRRERIDAQRAQLAQAEAALRGLDATFTKMTIRAPFDGVVTVRHREPGEIAAPGSPALTIRIYIPENRLGLVQIGQPATITSDTYRDRTYSGEVIFIASEAEFTPKSVQTQEERVKLVYAVKVRITGDPDRDLKPGIPADVRLDVKAL
jgi:HlyD family secretion protein